MTRPHLVSGAALLVGALLCTAAAPAQGASAAATSSAPTAAASSPAGVAPAGAQTPVPGRVKLVVESAVASPAFVIAGRQFVVRGTVLPYVGGQTITVTISRNGRRVRSKLLNVLAVGDGSGRFRLAYPAGTAGGILQASAAHEATTAQGAFTGRSLRVHVTSTDLGPGARGRSVLLLQSELSALHFAVPSNGFFDEATGQAVLAYRKLAGLARVTDTNAGVFELLQRGAVSFHVRYQRDGRHVEADLTRQVLAEIEPGGRVRSIYTMSSGKPSTPTVIGHFQVYSKTPGVNTEGMVDSNYFIRGYAIHGYPEVPTYAASHGCLRVPIPDAPAIFSWVRTGTAVDVYNESGGGSRQVNRTAGP